MSAGARYTLADKPGSLRAALAEDPRGWQILGEMLARSLT